MNVPSGCIMCPWVSPQHAGQTVNKDSNCLWQTMNSTALKTRKGKNTLTLTMTFFDTQTVPIDKRFLLWVAERFQLFWFLLRGLAQHVFLWNITYHQNGLYQKMTIHHHFVQDWPVESIFVSQTFRFESPHPPSEALPEQLRWKRFKLIVVHHYTFIGNNTCSI